MQASACSFLRYHKSFCFVNKLLWLDWLIKTEKHDALRTPRPGLVILVFEALPGKADVLILECLEH